MSTVQKAISGLLLIGTITVLTLPERTTVGVIKAGADGIRGIAATFMGIGKQV